MRKLKAVAAADPDEVLHDLKRQFIRHPLLQHKVMTSPSIAAGSTETGWYRGRHAGIFDAYLTLKNAFPEAAQALIDAYGMNEDGVITLY